MTKVKIKKKTVKKVAKKQVSKVTRILPILPDFVQSYIMNRGNQSAIAKELKIDPKTVYRYLQKEEVRKEFADFYQHRKDKLFLAQEIAIELLLKTLPKLKPSEIVKYSMDILGLSTGAQHAQAQIFLQQNNNQQEKKSNALTPQDIADIKAIEVHNARKKPN